jgi:predicted XRE-type DNA-binding protein
MGGGNTVFRDIGFPEDEAPALLLRGDPAIQIRIPVDTLDITHAEAAKCAGITRLRMNDLVNYRTHKFTPDALVAIATPLGCVVKPSLEQIA